MSESIFVIEEKREELQYYLFSSISPYKKLTSLNNFFSLLLAINNNHILKAYGSDLIDQYCSLLVESDIWCSLPAQHELILTTAEKLLSLNAFNVADNRLKKGLAQFQYKIDELTSVLNGKDAPASEINKYYFPLIDNTNKSGQLYGMLDSISVKITKGKEQKFHIIPSEKEIEARIKSQVEISWNVALNYAKRFIKGISSQHEVIISFDKRVGFYVGDSLGVALTLAYINELFFFYNAPLTITAKESCCFTGRISHNGETPSIGCENITKKIELIFYSGIKTFVIPKADEPAAEEKLRELKKEYPNRNLKLIAVTDIEDLLSRRNVVDIKKLSLIKRTGKTFVRNKVVSVLLVLFLLLLSSFYFYVYDDNPYGYEATQFGFNIINQSGKVLWTIKSPVSSLELLDTRQFETRIKVIDVNDDKRNEVAYCFSRNDAIADKNISNGVAFFDYKGNVFNKLTFIKTVYSKREIITPPFLWSLRDTLTYNGRKSLLMSVGNFNSYASAAFIIELKTQKIISDTLWNCGHLVDIKTVDLNNDGRKKIFGTAFNNGENRVSFFCLELSKFNGQIPSSDEYRFFNIKKAEVNNLFLLPKTDFVNFKEFGRAGLQANSLFIDKNAKSLRFATYETSLAEGGGVIYNWYYQSNDFSVAIAGQFAAIRDSLVAKGELKKPFTDTWEYRQLLHDQILQWNGKEFVPIKK